MRVKVEIIMDVDVDTEEQLEEVIQEMDYDFTYVQVDEGVGKTLTDRNLITNTEIRDFEITKYQP